jgi:hypothetical protein
MATLPYLLEAILYKRPAAEQYELLRRLRCLSATGLAEREAAIGLLEGISVPEGPALDREGHVLLESVQSRADAQIDALHARGYLDQDLCQCFGQLGGPWHEVVAAALAEDSAGADSTGPVPPEDDLPCRITHQWNAKRPEQHEPPAPSSDPGRQLALGLPVHHVVVYAHYCVHLQRPGRRILEMPLRPLAEDLSDMPLRNLVDKIEAAFEQRWLPPPWRATNPERILRHRAIYEERRAGALRRLEASFAPLHAAMDWPVGTAADGTIYLTYGTLARWLIGDCTLRNLYSGEPLDELRVWCRAVARRLEDVFGPDFAYPPDSS